MRIPKLRGVKHGPVRVKPVVINVGNLEKISEGGVLNKEILLKKKIIKKVSRPVKILGDGELKKALNLEGLIVSARAREKILAAGGTIK
jgi:large subunit ribosomal protein L15